MSMSAVTVEERADCVIVTGAEHDRQAFGALVAQARTMSVYAGAADVKQMRDGALRLADSALVRRPSPDVVMTPVAVEHLPAWWFRPRELRRTAPLLYFHGGGYVCGSVAGARGFLCALASAFGASVLAVDYRQGPEHRHPAAVEDARMSYDWLARRARAPITLIGESAGGALALRAALHASRDGPRAARAVIACSPWFDLSMSGASWSANAGRDLVSRAVGEFFVNAYLGAADRHAPGVSPSNDDLSGGPPLLMQVGGHELGLDDARSLARRARDAGVHTRLEIYAELPHGFLKFVSPIGDAAIGRLVAWEEALGPL